MARRTFDVIDVSSDPLEWLGGGRRMARGSVKMAACTLMILSLI
jgi:hypothetical protein